MLPTLQNVVGNNNVIEMDLITGAEDFSYYPLKTAGLFFFLGITPKEQDPATLPSNHSPHFYIDEQALPIGVESLTNLALNYLNTP